jgi:hypothetical protein
MNESRQLGIVAGRLNAKTCMLNAKASMLHCEAARFDCDRLCSITMTVRLITGCLICFTKKLVFDAVWMFALQ